MAGILSSMGRGDLDPTGAMLQLNEGTLFQQQQPDAEPETEKKKQRRKKKELEPLTVEAFLNAGHLPSAQSKSSKDNGRKPPEEISKTPDSAKPGKSDEVEGASCDSVGQSWEEQRETSPREPQDEMEICEEESQVGFEEEASKKYHFAWESMDADKLSDMTISSVHTSDLSSFDDDEEAEGRSTDKEAPSSNADETAGESRSEPKIEAPESVERNSKKGVCEYVSFGVGLRFSHFGLLVIALTSGFHEDLLDFDRTSPIHCNV